MIRKTFFAALAITQVACAATEPPEPPKVPAPVAAVSSSEPAVQAPAATPTVAPPPEPKAAPSAPLPEIPKGTAVLHVGDSFALAGFSQALKPRMKALGVRYEVRADTSSFTTTWSGKMDRLVADMQPDLVLITLGANEVSNTDPAAHAPAIRHIVSAIGSRPCVWISPPSWKKDTGIIDVIRQNSAPCRFFDSDKLVAQPIPRQKDQIHPNEQGGAIWADAFWAWLQDQRAPADAAAAQGKAKKSPWLLKPAAPGEHASAEGAPAGGSRAALAPHEER